MDFYLERTPIPYETIQTIEDNGKAVDSLIVTDPDPAEFKLRRTIQSGILMSPSTALNVYKWLNTGQV